MTTPTLSSEINSHYAAGPARLEAALSGLTDSELDLALAEDTWSIRQIVHHLADGDDIWNGKVLAIRDSTDNPSGSCQELLDYSEGGDLGQHDEIVINIGTGHAILYTPLDEWIQPTVEWVKDCTCNE